MKILLIGSGGREHALAWSLSRSSCVEQVLVAPGNPGTAAEPKVVNVTESITKIADYAQLAKREEVDLTVVGPEQPIADGIRDHFDQEGLMCFAPSRKAAQLESSKSFAKEFMFRHGIPTANSYVSHDFEDVRRYLENRRAPIVVKANGLAAGKGVTVAQSLDQALTAARGMLSGESFGSAGRKILIEDYLDGEEASFIVMSDGENVIPFATSQDHKPVFDGDRGPNTGGMGAYSPAPIVTAEMAEKVLKSIVLPTIEGMASEGIPFQGFLYVGLMIVRGSPFVIEYNCRFGDPEAQPVLLRCESDLASKCMAAVSGGLHNQSLQFTDRPAVAVVLASGGYPGDYVKGHKICGLDFDETDTKIFHAGTALDGDGTVTNGGRVVTVVGMGNDIETAQKTTYNRAHQIQWKDRHMRLDIAHRAISG